MKDKIIPGSFFDPFQDDIRQINHTMLFLARYSVKETDENILRNQDDPIWIQDYKEALVKL